MLIRYLVIYCMEAACGIGKRSLVCNSVREVLALAGKGYVASLLDVLRRRARVFACAGGAR